MQDAKRRAIIFFVIALLLAAIAGYLFLQKVSAVDDQLGRWVTVYVAAQDISLREPLKPEYFKAVEIPKRFVQDSQVTDLNAIQIGDYTVPIEHLVAVVPLAEGDVLTHNMLKTQSSLTENNKRMVTLAQSNRIQFDGTLDYNDRVDLIVSDKKGNENVTEVFMKDILVVGLAKDEDGSVKGIGLELTMEQARKLIHAQNFAIAIRVLKAPTEDKEGKKAPRGEELNIPEGEGSDDSPSGSVHDGTDEGLLDPGELDE